MHVQKCSNCGEYFEFIAAHNDVVCACCGEKQGKEASEAMLTNYDYYRLISLRPAACKGKQVILSLELKNARLFREAADVCSAIGMKAGDTCSVRARLVCRESQHEYVDLYMSEDTLDDFIACFGTEGIQATAVVAAEVLYAVYDAVVDGMSCKREVTGFKVNRILFGE